MRLLALSENSSRLIKTIAVLLLLLIVGFLGILAVWEMDLSLLYVLPIAFATWFLSFRAGFVTCIVCIAVWFRIDSALLHTYTSEFIHYWNTFIRLAFFVLICLILDSLTNAHEREKSLARTDGLTGVANSRSFHELLEMEIARSRRYKRPFTLAYIDLDNSKSVNDQSGHTTGDKALKTIAEYIRMNLRTMDVLGRLGGDEFAMLFPETDQNSVCAIISKLQDGLLQEMRKHSWPIPFSIGVLTCDTFYLQAREMIKAADALMYAIKSANRDAVKYGTTIDSQTAVSPAAG